MIAKEDSESNESREVDLNDAKKILIFLCFSEVSQTVTVPGDRPAREACLDPIRVSTLEYTSTSP